MNTGNNDKKYWTIGEVTKLTGIKQSVLRFWEQEFEQLRPIKNKFGHRMYTKKEIDTILKIKDLLYTKKMTIKGAKELLENSNKKEFNVKIIKEGLEELLKILRKKEGL